MTTLDTPTLPDVPAEPPRADRRRRSGPATWLGTALAVTGTVLAFGGGAVFAVKPFRLTGHDEPGTATPLPPASQSFWVASDEGRDRVDLDWAVRDDTYRMVVMNADGSGGVHTSTTLAVTLPHVAAVAATTAGVGLALRIGGLVVVLAGRRRRAATPPPLA